MRTNRRWAVSVAAFLGLGLTCASGCQTVMGGMTLPSGRYLDHYPQYFAPDPAFPLPRELNSMEDPDGAARRNGGLGAAPVAPAAPVPVPGGPGGPIGGP
ncbi:hypothetical protein [Frigoriglobus tundricola]|uniref:Lipoprotein n=1 Tax=Frigoriglobus tundricola TaxID=2774151 RepID=A0A6M5YIA1_9BACT|nr:hypothetical protein [Frigoriglobus tundricola]QJW92996.1 hypothetical protein FTUN_0496 [Frigoriglobus tundricola]